MEFRIAIYSLVWLIWASPVFVKGQETISATDYRRWEKGVSKDPNYFPIGVWLQAPRNAEKYRNAGINLYVGLWKGPTEEQLQVLQQAGMKLICSQNDVGMQSKYSDVIAGWMHGDEPDNAQSRRDGKGYDPPILPSVIQADYERIRRKDPSRPVLLNLGQGVAFDQYMGRGTRRNHPEDYAEYVQGSDIVSFDIYPAVHDHPDVAGKLERVAEGVERLRKWSKDEKIVWNCIECSRISNEKVKPNASQIRAEVWMSIIHGSRGLIYFVHQFKPTFQEASVLNDQELLPAITELNRQIQSLAPVLNSPSLDGKAITVSDDAASRIAVMCKEYLGDRYIFAVNMRNNDTKVNIRMVSEQKYSVAEVLGEERRVELRDQVLQDSFPAYGVHLYHLRLQP